MTTDGNTFAPDTYFEFDVKSALGGSATIDGDTVTVKDGIDDVLSVADVHSAPNAAEGTQASYTFDGAITVDATKLAGHEPGIYHYTINEKTGNYEGIDYDTIAIFKNKAKSRRNGTSLSSQKAKLSEKHIVSRSEEHPGSVP